jgi:hypothetical protein
MIKSFTMKLAGTRKERSWVAYASSGEGKPVTIQSSDSIADVYPDDTGRAIVRPGGAFFHNLVWAKPCVFPAGTYAMAVSSQPRSGDHFGQGVYQL